MPHIERHYFDRIGWLRAAVLGANDGIVSTASLVVGVAASGAERGEILIAGVAGLVAGAMSMAAGEYVSVSSQADTEAADMARERQELATAPEQELAELVGIYKARGLPDALAREVAIALTAHDAFGAHARDELGIVEHQRARPLQAALASAGTFAVGAALPLVAAWLSPETLLAWIVTASALVFLMILGWLSASVGGSRRLVGTARVTFWGAAAMAITYGVGRLFGAVV